jgi:4-amino-4-deoxy-L-arabinose transferase-like glycosyltransferase
MAVLRIVLAYPETGITFDEPGHMACGLQYLSEHVYLYESEHPPLARVMAALGPFLDHARPTWQTNQDREGLAVLYRNTQVLRTLVLMRLGILPFFLLASAVVYLWATRYFGKVTGVAATALFTMMPPVLAHAGLATTDMALTGCLGAAFFSLIVWAEKPGIRESVWLGVTAGLMVLSKFTALGFFPVAAVFGLAAVLVCRRPTFGLLTTLGQRRLVPFVMAIAAGALVIWAGYLFSFGKVAGWNVSMPAPEVFNGIRNALHHNAVGHFSYLLGRVSTAGWWYYFPVVLAVKTPLGYLALLGLGLYLACRSGREVHHILPLALAS